MPRPGRSKPKNRTKDKRPIHKIDQRPVNKILPRSNETGNPNLPVRTVLYIEVGDLPTAQTQELCRILLKHLNNGHPHYVVPLRFGKLTCEVVFEKEFLTIVRSICKWEDVEGKSRDGQIVLKDGAQDVDIIRKKI